MCAQIVCEPTQCFGYPLKIDPDVCCPQCDWGIADDACAPIPVANLSLYATLGDSAQCQHEVIKHDCDKSFLLKNGQIFECIPKKRGISIVTEDCEDIRKVVYKDTTKCKLRRPRVPIADFDPNPTLCAIRV